jgi:hypothetical protein
VVSGGGWELGTVDWNEGKMKKAIYGAKKSGQPFWGWPARFQQVKLLFTPFG